MKGGETRGGRKKREEEEESTGHMALCIYIYIYIHAIVVNCQRYYGLCPVREQQSLPPPLLFFPHSSPLSKR